MEEQVAKETVAPMITKEQAINNVFNNASSLINRELRIMAQDLINIMNTPSEKPIENTEVK